MGTIFQYSISSSTLTKKFDFNETTDGAYPVCSLMQASDGNLYGVTQTGGFVNVGYLFKYNPSNNVYTKIIEFGITVNGGYSGTSLIQASNGKLYGMTQTGGTNYKGTIFEYDIISNTFVKKYDFDISGIDGKSPYGNSFMQASDGKLYGLAAGGLNNLGVLFQYNPVTNVYVKKIDFDSTYVNATGSLMQASNGKLYGVSAGDPNNAGTLFQYDIVSNVISKKIDFDGITTGSSPYSPLIQTPDGKIYGLTSDDALTGQGKLYQYDPVTNLIVKKFDFDGVSHGGSPSGGLLKASDGKLYGITAGGGANSLGTLFQYDPINDVLVKKIDFNGVNGAKPVNSLIEISTVVNIVEKKSTNELIIYPNPTNDYLNINIGENNFESISFELYDGLGKIIYSTDKMVSSINLSSFADGIYILKTSIDTDVSYRKIMITK